MGPPGFHIHWWVSSKFCVGLFKILVPLCWTLPPPQDRPLQWTAPPPDRPKFRSFFSSPATVFFLSSLSWGSFRGILVVFLKAGTLKCARLEFSGCRVKPRRFKNTTQKSTRRPLREGRKNENCGGRSGKGANFGPLHPFGAPPLQSPTPSGPLPSGPRREQVDSEKEKKEVRDKEKGDKTRTNNARSNM